MTTTSTANVVCDNSSLANFKSWGQFISNAFSAFGWTQTADTGQVNWGSIASVPASTYVYEVWKASDALAATMPIFVKVEYGFSATVPQFRMTVGTNSNGSGTITGQVVTSAPWQITASVTNQGASTFPCYASGSTGEFRLAMWNPAAGSPQLLGFFFIERSKDNTGANTNSYVTIGYANGSTTIGQTLQQSISASVVYAKGTGIFSTCPALMTGLDNGTTAAFPCFPHIGSVGNPFLGVMLAFQNDAAANSTCTVASMYGSTHTYIALGANNSFSSNFGVRGNGSPGAVTALMRFE